VKEKEDSAAQAAGAAAPSSTLNSFPSPSVLPSAALPAAAWPGVATAATLPAASLPAASLQATVLPAASLSSAAAPLAAAPPLVSLASVPASIPVSVPPAGAPIAAQTDVIEGGGVLETEGLGEGAGAETASLFAPAAAAP